jgi:hypothetical protein
LEVDQSTEKILQNLLKLFSFVTHRLPTTSLDYVKKVIPGAIGIIATSRMMLVAENPALTKLEEDYQQLLKSIEAVQKKVTEKEVVERRLGKYWMSPNEENELHGMAPPNDFREIPIIPTVEEIMSTEEAFLRTNKKAGAYTDSDHYLDVQYRLLREDFVSPLKRGIQDFVKYR